MQIQEIFLCDPRPEGSVWPGSMLTYCQIQVMPNSMLIYQAVKICAVFKTVNILCILNLIMMTRSHQNVFHFLCCYFSFQIYFFFNLFCFWTGSPIVLSCTLKMLGLNWLKNSMMGPQHWTTNSGCLSL